MTFNKALILNFCFLSYCLEANASDEARQHIRNTALSRSFILEDFRFDSPDTHESQPQNHNHPTTIAVDPFTIAKIQNNLLKNGEQVENLEGGYVLIFNTSGKLLNPKMCQLGQVNAAMNLGSPEAYFVKGVIDEVHGIYEFAFRNFATAASGNDGNGQRSCGGTSTELCFYNFYKLLSQGGFKKENGELIQTSQQLKYKADDYKKFTTPENILAAQLQSVIEVVKNQSRSSCHASLTSCEPRKHTLLFSLISPRKHAQPVNHQDLKNGGDTTRKSPLHRESSLRKIPETFPPQQVASKQVEALVSPRLTKK